MTTITHEQATALFDHTGTLAAFLRKLAESGITVTPPQPSPEMVKLAQHFARQATMDVARGVAVNAAEAAALAALQHVERVVKDLQPDWQDSAHATEALLTILTAIGSK